MKSIYSTLPERTWVQIQILQLVALNTDDCVALLYTEIVKDAIGQTQEEVKQNRLHICIPFSVLAIRFLLRLFLN